MKPSNNKAHHSALYAIEYKAIKHQRSLQCSRIHSCIVRGCFITPGVHYYFFVFVVDTLISMTVFITQPQGGMSGPAL